MPGLTSLPLNLSEILEARRGPLRELEIWALLCQCAEALQDLIIKGEAGGNNTFRRMMTPNTLLIRDNGTIQLTENAQSPQGSLYLAPEFEPESQQFISDAAFEKMFVYSLGRTLQVASEFGLRENEVLGISYDLDSLLQTMSEKNAAFRLSLMQILEACSLQASQHPDKLPHSLILSRLYKSILGGNHKRSFNDSNYSSDHSHEAVMTHQPGRARRPRPQVRHRHVRRKRASTSSSPSPNSRSRSRSRSPSQRNAAYHAELVGSNTKLNFENHPSLEGKGYSSAVPAGMSSAFTTPTSSQLLNMSMTSTASELSAKRQQAPPYSAAHSVQGLLGLRQGSPAFQKYIKLKERQIRRRQAKSGQAPSILDDVRSRLMTSPLMSSEMMENISETHSMASLMSYTLGTYKPYLHAELGSEAALNIASEAGTENESQMSSLLYGMDYGNPSRVGVQPVPGAAVRDVHEAYRAYSSVQGMQENVAPREADAAEALASTLTDRQRVPATLSQPLHTQSVAPISERLYDVQSPLKPESGVITEKDFDGYEYLHNLKKPAIHVAMPLQGDSLKNATLARRVTVIHLTGQKLEVVLDPSSTARQLFDTVLPYVELDDFFFFGLTYISEKEHFFLDADIKLHKVAPDGWKDGPKSHQSYVTFNLYLRVKFYPESPADFRHIGSHHLLYLQLRGDILEGRITTNQELMFKLAGLALQAEYGDFVKEKSSAPEGQPGTLSPYFTAEHYLPASLLKEAGTSVAYTKATRRHKASAGISCVQAEAEFIKLVQALPEYGIHFHKLSPLKNQSQSMIWIGLSQHRLVVAEPTVSSARAIVQSHLWSNILKISFNKRRFSVQPKVEGARGKPPKLNFYTNSYRKGRYLLQFSTEQHRFEIRMKSRPQNMETLADVSADEAMPKAINAETETVEAFVSRTNVDPALQPLPDDDKEADDDLDVDWGWPTERSPEHSLQYRSPPPYQAPRMAQVLGGDQVFPGTEPSSMHASFADLHSSEFDKHHLQTLLDMSSEAQGLDSVPANRDEKAGVSSPSHLPHFEDASSYGRRIFEVTLEKEESHGVGITIVGGETTSSLDLGIFVKSVVPGGPAERDGRIRCGDRLIAIGTTSLEGKQHHEAVAMIRDSGPHVTFLVSQVRPPGSVKKRRSPSYSETVEFEKKLRDSMLEYRHGSFEDVEGEDGFSKLNNMNETLLRFDNFASKHSPHGLSDDDHACQSDEENYPLEPPPPPPSDPSPSYTLAQLSRQQHLPQAHFYETEEQRVPNPDSHLTISPPPLQAASKSESHLVPNLNDNKPAKQDATEQQKTFLTEDERELLKLQDDENLARALLEEAGECPQAEGYDGGALTEEEQEDLQILGDIAALDADDSSSDSDFDSAIKKTIDGPSSKIYPSNKAVNTVSPMVFNTAPDNKAESDEFLSNDVVYEVILERDKGGFGLVAHPPLPQERVHPGQRASGVYVEDVVQDSPAHRGGILAPGDRILEVSGHNVVHKDSKTVQDLIDSAPNLITVKVSRSLERDLALDKKETQPDLKKEDVKPERKPEGPSQSGNVHLSELIPQAPVESTPPLDDLEIVPPPPPINFGYDNSESNTQSDVDSDVLDSSRSDTEDLYKNTDTIAIHAPAPHAATRVEEKQSAPRQRFVGDYEGTKTEDEKPNKAENSSFASDTLKLDGSTEFDEKLNELKNELDKQLTRENASPNSLSKSSGSSSTESIVLSPRKLVESLSTKAKKEEESDGEEEREDEKEHDDDDDVVVTMYGDDPVEDQPVVKEKGKKKPKKPSEEEILDPFEPVLLDVTLKRLRDGFGFTVAGGVSTGGCYIKQLVSEPAISDGRLRPGDKILQVNGQDTTSLGHVETVTLLRKLADVARLKLLRFPSSMETQQRVKAAQAQAQMASVNPEPTQGESETSEESGEQVQKSVQELSKALDTPKAIIHPYDYKGSLLATPAVGKPEDIPASEASSVREGDDGTAPPQEDRVFQVELHRPVNTEAVLGITLAEKESEGQTLVCVKRLKAGGLASRDGRLRRGDAILQVNGTPLTGLTVREAVSYLREAGEQVVLTVSRSERRGGSGDESNHEDDHEHLQDVGNHEEEEDDDISVIAEEAGSLLQDQPEARVFEHYDSFRKAVTDVPVILSEEWVNALPLMRMAVDTEKNKEYTRLILQSLADLVESGEPNEAFKSIRQMKESGPCSVGHLPENKQKNRYRNVLPYDANRIKISGRGEAREYINASFVEMPLVNYSNKGSDDGDGSEKDGDKTTDLGLDADSNKCLKYIACQGPLEGTVSDLWALIWQEQVHVVAMLTQTQESGKLKCFPYWPQSKTDVVSVDDGALQVRLVRSYSLQDFDVVQMTIEETGTDNRQEVILLQYRGWPDHGAPDTALPLLKLLQVMHLLENGSPPVIHCSAGIGRTGAFIAIDVALACIEHGVQFNLHNIVCKLRTQRHGMVQTTDQYLFCYTACMEALLSMDLT